MSLGIHHVCVKAISEEKLKESDYEKATDLEEDYVEDYVEEKGFAPLIDSTFDSNKKVWKTEFNPDLLKGQKLSFDLVDAKTGKVVFEKGQKLISAKAKKLQKDGLSEYVLPEHLFHHL